MRTEPPVIIAGHSHIEALVGHAFVKEPILQPAVTTASNIYALHGPWPRDEAYWGLLKANTKGAGVALVWRGNEHNEYFFFQSEQPFDLYSPRVRPLMTSLNILPQQQIRKKFRPHFEDLVTVLNDLKTFAPAGLCVVGTPPPKGDEAFLRKVLAAEPFFAAGVEHRGKSVDEVEITHPRVRLKLWYLVQDLLRESAKKASVEFIEVPDETRDSEGFLKPEYWYPDVTHANADYGRIMVEHILRSMRR